MIRNTNQLTPRKICVFLRSSAANFSYVLPSAFSLGEVMKFIRYSKRTQNVQLQRAFDLGISDVWKQGNDQKHELVNTAKNLRLSAFFCGKFFL